MNDKYNKNSDALQYRFTAYVQKAIDRARWNYLKQCREDNQIVVSLDEMIEAGKDLSSSVDFDAAAFFSIKDFEQLIENDALSRAILELSSKERQILALHIIYKVPISEIADLLGANYNTVYSIYARTLKKIAKKLGEENE